MIRDLLCTKLKNGREVVIQIVSSPDVDALPELARFLGHKYEHWGWHIREGLRGATPGLEARFYLARVNGRLAGNITIFQNANLGNLAHVFTAPEMRGQGIAKLLMEVSVNEFKKAGGRIAVLGTDYMSMPWKLYESFGFVGTCPEQQYGGMIRFLGNVSWDGAVNGPPGAIQDAGWEHFVGTQVLFASPAPDQLRGIVLHSIGPRLVEEQFIRLKRRQSLGEKVLFKVQEGALPDVLGCAVIAPHPIWGACGTRLIMDFFAHPKLPDGGKALLNAALADCTAPVECCCDSMSERKILALAACGFRKTAIVPDALTFGKKASDLIIMCR